MFFLYRLLSTVLSPFWFVYFFVKAVKNGEALRVFERLGIATIKRNPGARCIWIHAVSVGEVNSVITFANHIKALNSNIDVLITTGTLTGAKIAIERGFLHQYLPLDLSWCISRFLKYWTPEFVMFVDSEIWPNLMQKLNKKDIPAILLNARLSKKSFARWRHFRKFFASILKRYTVILPQSHTEFENFTFFTSENVEEINNLKYSVTPKTYDCKRPNRKIFIAASTHRGEEQTIIDAHKELVQKYPRLLTIIAPRHPDRAKEIIPMLTGMRYSIRTETRDINDDVEIYLADTLGELDFMYSISDIAFVGGSLVNVGGHNIFEPAAQKCAVIHGNYMSNFFDMSEYFSAVMYQVSSGDELVSVVDSLLTDEGALEYIRSQTYSLAQELNKNVVHSVYTLIKKHVEGSSVLV